MTYVTDPIGDFITRMRNAQAARRPSCTAPHSKMKLALAELMKREGWLQDVKVIGEEPKLTIEVTFIPGKRRLVLERKSKPGRRLYTSASELRPILRGFGQAILTTSQGLVTDKEAREKKIGGEYLCTIS
ncbi:MAG: 30S ribosomal protein S8 [Candidatus Peribacteraceae bacterium]|nr:30S ribosomal protein S8 [Candidatus Peribacteraceae bacterium]